MNSLHIQWSLDFATEDILKFLREVEDLPLETRNKISKMFTTEFAFVVERTDKHYIYFANTINHIYVITKILLLHKNIKHFTEILQSYAEFKEYDFTDFWDIVENLNLSCLELVNKYWIK